MKVLRRILLALVLLIVALLVGAFVFLDPLVGAAIEKGSTYATGVETRVGGVDASPFAGSFALSDLSLENPAGFRREPFLRLGSARAAWQNGTIFSDTIEMDELALERVEVNLEKSSAGSNWGAILDHLRKIAPPDPEPAAASGKTLRIARIVIRDVRAGLHLADVPLVSGSTEVLIPEIVIEDFRSDGSTTEIVGKLVRAVLEAVLEHVRSSGGNVLPADVLKDLDGRLSGLRGAVESDAKDFLKGLGESLKDGGGLLKPK